MTEENKTEELKWEKIKGLKMDNMVGPIVNELILIIEEEKKRNLQKLEETKKMIEKLNNSRF